MCGLCRYCIPVYKCVSAILVACLGQRHFSKADISASFKSNTDTRKMLLHTHHLNINRYRALRILFGIIAIILGIFVPTIGIIIASSIETEPYIFDDIPPTICIPRHYGVHFYSTTFPDIIMTSIYSVMVIVTIIIIHRVSK